MPDLESERLTNIVPYVEQDEERPDFLEPEPEDHPWVTALEVDLSERTGIQEPYGDTYCLDPSIMQLDPGTAYILGYQEAIHKLRSVSNDDGLRIELIEVEVPDADASGEGGRPEVS